VSGFDHALVVGGSGMLAGCCRKLLTLCKTVTVMARNETRIKAIAPGVVPLVCDYDADEAIAALAGLSPDLVVAWVHGRLPAFRRALAARVRPQGRFVQVLGSAHGDPSRPERLEEMKAVVKDLPLRYQAVVLGFTVERGMSRWLTDDEISDGVFAAILDNVPISIVGTVTPWSAKP
jgi:hypothetical protein